MACFLNFRPSTLLKHKNCQSISAYPRNTPYNNYPIHMQKRGLADDDHPAKCKVALITGGARGIGFHISEQLLKAGAQAVIIGDILVDACEEATCKLNEKYGENKALFQPCDVTKKNDMEKIFKCTKERFGKIDIVVNNAGILADSRWEQTLCINNHGLVHGTLLGFQYMGAQNCGPGGFIINVASILGLQPLYSSPVYVGTKHFIIGFTRSMGSEYFYNISKVKVMAVCPGVTDTNMIWEAKDGGLPGFGDLGQELVCSLASLPPQGPEEVGKGVVTIIKDGENGSVWVSEACEFYKCKLPDRKTFKEGCPPKDQCKKVDASKKEGDSKKEDPCKKKDPCKKDDPAKKKGPAKKEALEKKKGATKKEDIEKKKGPAKKEVPEKKKDPCQKDDSAKKKEPCSKPVACKDSKKDTGKKEDNVKGKKEEEKCKDGKGQSKDKTDDKTAKPPKKC